MSFQLIVVLTTVVVVIVVVQKVQRRIGRWRLRHGELVGVEVGQRETECVQRRTVCAAVRAVGARQ